MSTSLPVCGWSIGAPVRPTGGCDAGEFSQALSSSPVTLLSERPSRASRAFASFFVVTVHPAASSAPVHYLVMSKMYTGSDGWSATARRGQDASLQRKLSSPTRSADTRTAWLGGAG